MRARRWWPLLVLGGVGAFLLARSDRPAPPRPSVLLVTLDTTRTDAVGTGTPGLTAFLAQATRFPAARTSVPLTLPAHLTLMTGLGPSGHGVHENLAPRLPAGRGFPLLAEEFRAAGYATGAFVSSGVLGPQTGLDAGFETFESPDFAEPWSGDQGDVPAPDRVAAALQWLERRDPVRPFFLWVHFFDPHVPYLPFEGDAKRPATHEGDSAEDLYRGEVRRMDAAVERLLGATPSDAVVVIVSDHGEGLGDHGESTHGVLCHGATLNLLLGVRAPGLTAGERRDGLRSLTDVAPTLRAMCGLDPQPGEGRTLLEPAPPGRVVVSESLWTYRTYGWAQVFSATDGRFSLVEAGPRLELFDLASDPDETQPLDPSGHEAFERLDRALIDYRRGGGAEPDEAYVVTGSPYGTAVRPLSSYLPRAENARLRDPGDGFDFKARMNTARALIYRGKTARDAAALERAVAMLRALAAEDPANPAPHLYLVHAQGRLGWLRGRPDLHRAAAASARDAIDRGYTVAPLLYDLLYESLYAGGREDLRAALEVAWNRRIVADTNCADLARQAGDALLALGDREAAGLALRFLERCERQAPESARDRFAALRAQLAAQLSR